MQMRKVYNWQLGRNAAYIYPQSRPKKQWAIIFDLNKCISCQTCSLACKTTWTSGKGQEYMFWNNVETKPYGGYPIGWDIGILAKLGFQEWEGDKYIGKTLFEAAEKDEKILQHLSEDEDWAHPTLARTRWLRQSTRETGLPCHIESGCSTFRGHALTAHILHASLHAPEKRYISGKRTASFLWTSPAAAGTGNVYAHALTRRRCSMLRPGSARSALAAIQR